MALPYAFIVSRLHFEKLMPSSSAESPSSPPRMQGSDVGKSRQFFEASGSNRPRSLRRCARPSLSSLSALAAVPMPPYRAASIVFSCRSCDMSCACPLKSFPPARLPTRSAWATIQRRSRLCGAPTAQAGIIIGCTSYPAFSKSAHTC